MQFKSMIKLVVGAALLLVIGLVGINSYTIVQDGSVKVGTFLGKVSQLLMMQVYIFQLTRLQRLIRTQQKIFVYH